MKFLDPINIAIAAGLTVPLLVALYFLKLKRTIRPVPSTLLWKKAIEDLRVNAPFQKLRKSLLLLLQLLVLALAALALGKPMFQAAQKHEGTLILLIDQSASMSVLEKGGLTRLEQAREQARNVVDAMSDDARAMVIAFSDRANVVSSFDTDKQAIKRKIDSIEQTQSTSSLTEAISLAEAYSQNLIIGGEAPGTDVGAPVSAAPAASVFLFSDGRIEDSEKTPFRQIDPSKMRMTMVGERSDNVAILSMAARRNFERPSFLEVTATVRNFGSQAVTADATLYVDGKTVDVKAIQLSRGRVGQVDPEANQLDAADAVQDARQIVVFDQIEFGGGGVAEVVLKVDDALTADDRAWSVIDPPRRLRVLLVSPDNLFLEDVLTNPDIDLVKMTGPQYENAPENQITAEKRSLFDVVILDRHSTARLPQGNFFFWGAVPQIEGVSMGEPIKNEILFDWDETHPVLRYIAMDAIDVLEWFALQLPSETKSIVDGESSPVLAHLTRGASQFLICAFPLVIRDEKGATRFNTDWPIKLDFVIFMQNALQFLASNQSLAGQRTVVPGEPVTLLASPDTAVTITRPNGTTDVVNSGQQQSIHYGRTRQVGVYRVEPATLGQNAFAVNLFNETESNVAPVKSLTVGAEGAQPQTTTVEVNRPAWRYVLLGVLGFLLLEWVVYNRRVMV